MSCKHMDKKGKREDEEDKKRKKEKEMHQKADRHYSPSRVNTKAKHELWIQIKGLYSQKDLTYHLECS